MRNIKTHGLILFIYSNVYKILSLIFYDLFYNSNLLIYLNPLITFGFFYLWYYYGYHNKLGFKYGLNIGIIGSIDGIICSILSMKFLIEPDSSSLWFMYLWMKPLNFIIQHLSFSGISNFVPQISVIIVILLTGIGGYIGKCKSLSDDCKL